MRHRPPSALMMTRLALASWETIARRSMLMAAGTCSPAEYRRMVAEKVAATQRATFALLGGGGANAVMAPYLVRARSNAKRLRARAK